MIPVFLLLTALVVDVGNWYTHKRQLQNRADAGAFAAAVEYQRSWEDCVQGGNASLKLDTAKNIANAAREYAGDAEAADYEPTTGQPSPSTLSKYNTQIANQANVDVTINSNSPTYDDDLDYKDGRVGDRADPCYNHAGDSISPAGGYWTDVRVKERNLPSFFGRLGVPLARNGARARVEIRPTIDKGFLPLGIADSQISKMQVRLYKDCGDGAEIARENLVRLPNTLQIDPSDSLWAKYDATSGTVGSTPVPIPRIGDCGDPPPENVPVRVEVRIASREAVDITSPTCATLAAARYADCWGHLSHLRVYDGGGSPNARPVVRRIDLTPSGSPACAPDAYFARLPEGATNWTCGMGASVAVDWGNRVQQANTAFRVSVEGQVLQTILQSAIPAGQSEITFQGNGINSSPLAPPGGANPISVKLEWLDIDPTHRVNGATGAPCKSDPATTPCIIYQETHATAHQTFVGTDANAGIVQLVRLSLSPVSAGGLPPALGSIPAAPTANEPPAQLYLTVGLRNNLTFGRFTVIRAGDPQANSSLVCDPDYTQGKTYQMFRDGCKPPYSTNTLAIQNVANPPAEWTFWWDTVNERCPPANQWFNTTYPHAPWRCLATEPGFRPSQIADGLAAATGNCIPGNNSCNNYTCWNPNFYNWHLQQVSSGALPAAQAFSTMPPGWSPPDKRLIKVYILPYNALRNSTGNDTIPVLDFSYFYVTGWIGNGGNNQDPCDGSNSVPATPDDGPNDNARGVIGGAVGYFVRKAAPPDLPVDRTQNCVPGQLRECKPVLVR
jgi:hypothetical protein